MSNTRLILAARGVLALLSELSARAKCEELNAAIEEAENAPADPSPVVSAPVIDEADIREAVEIGVKAAVGWLQGDGPSLNDAVTGAPISSADIFVTAPNGDGSVTIVDGPALGFAEPVTGVVTPTETGLFEINAPVATVDVTQTVEEATGAQIGTVGIGTEIPADPTKNVG